MVIILIQGYIEDNKEIFFLSHFDDGDFYREKSKWSIRDFLFFCQINIQFIVPPSKVQIFQEQVEQSYYS